MPYNLTNNLILTILRDYEMLGKYQNLIELQQKSPEKLKLNFPRSALFHVKTRFCLKYFPHDYLCKQYFASKQSQPPLNLIYLKTL